MRNYGLIGKNISYSFSEKFFEEFFKKNRIYDCKYQIYDLENLKNIKSFLKDRDIIGLNVTIPYKEEILKYVDEFTEEVKEIGASNVLLIKNEKVKAYNTDIFGFEKSIITFLEKSKVGLILGTGGASKAVEYILNKYNINVSFTSSSKEGENIFSYKKIKENGLGNYDIIINCTPLGTFPKVDYFPDIPYSTLKKNSFFIDLIYNPIETVFMKEAKKNGGIVKNGLEMLTFQAEKSWDIWSKENIV